MDKFVIKGGNSLNGEVEISGAKNSLLALMPATLLANGTFTFYNVPNLSDIKTMLQLLNNIGVSTSMDMVKKQIQLDTTSIKSFEAPYEYVKKMRASIYVLGPMLARYGEAKVSLPGGCAWGPRPVDLHIDGIKKLGADIKLNNGYIFAKAKKLQGTKIVFNTSSVGATGNILMASTLAKGTTEIHNAAIEPEITQLSDFLNKMGAKIYGIGTNTLTIDGVDELYPTDETIIPDRIEAATFLCACAIVGGKIKLKNIIQNHLTSVLEKLRETGVKISTSENEIEIFSDSNIKVVDIETAPYPNFPTDVQAQWIALMSIANGVSKIKDTIYFDRFKHVPELNRLGANIVVKENVAIVNGVENLVGAKVMSTDLRASASLILSGLKATGITQVLRVYHLDRGYEAIERKLQRLGADIKRVKGEEY